MTNTFSADGQATLIGSLPVTDHDEALDIIFKFTPAVPLWPQLPSNPVEGMLNQFIENLPGIVEEADKTFFDTSAESFETDLLAFFEDYLAVTEGDADILTSRFAVSEERACGLYHLLAKPEAKQAKALKGQITGPFTLLTGLHDRQNRLGYYDPTIREMAVKGLAMKAAWQTAFLSQAGLPTIMFIDEPALAGLGSSSFISVSLDDIGADLAEVIDAIHQQGGKAGVHVCANTEWNLLLGLDLDVLSFDAFAFFDRLITCKDQLYKYLERGAIIAWGIIPTSEEEHITAQSSESLTALWEEQAEMLVGPGWDKAAILKQTLITPSCGTGSMTLALAEKVLTMTRDVSANLRAKYLP